MFFNIIYLWRKNKEWPNRLKSFLFAKLNCCSTLKFTVFNRQPEGSFMCSQELVMNHNKRECKDTFGTGCTHSCHKCLLQLCVFSVATGFTYLEVVTEFELEDILVPMSPFVSAEGMSFKDMHTETRSKCSGQQKTYCASLLSAKNISAPQQSTTHLSLNVKYVLLINLLLQLCSQKFIKIEWSN